MVPRAGRAQEQVSVLPARHSREQGFRRAGGFRYVLLPPCRERARSAPVGPAGPLPRRRGQESLPTAVRVVVLKALTGASRNEPIWDHFTTVTVLPARPTENRAMSEAPQVAVVWTP